MNSGDEMLDMFEPGRKGLAHG